MDPWDGKLLAIPAMPLGPITGKGPDSGRWLMLSLAGEPSKYILNPSLLDDEETESDVESLGTGEDESSADTGSAGTSPGNKTEVQLPEPSGLGKYGLFLLSPNRCPAVAPPRSSESRLKRPRQTTWLTERTGNRPCQP